MRFWDTSALVHLFVEQEETERARSLHAADPVCAVWTLSDIEVRSAIARLVRAGSLTERRAAEFVEKLNERWGAFHVVAQIEPIKLRARRLVGVHPLRAADALQLAAALTAASDDPASLEFVCYDERLCDAARREGFRVVG